MTRSLNSSARQIVGEGPDVYQLPAGGRLQFASDRSNQGARRETGKTAELTLGFGVGVGPLARMATKDRLDMTSAYSPLWDAASRKQRAHAMERYAEAVRTGNNDGLEQETSLACALIVSAWRKANPQLWPRGRPSMGRCGKR